ncbi:beta-propeller fold lactonase family protein [Streptomyces sp. NPDC056601]|uniref:protein kinase domain-containing protein n=1 Tax=unclassified Streptomyces TaxID=2593676 RepID=UPI0036B90AA0
MTGAQEAADPLIAGRYRLLRRLGTGGMGRVWLAYDQGLACEVALKEVVLPPDLPEREVGARVARARSEAQHAARLRNHPNVVTVYDIVEEGGLPWIVMEFIPGAMDLEAVVREQGPLPPAQVALIGLAVLDALLEGHRLGILHRDVKPANILLTHYESHLPHPPEDGQVLLTDYGIALEPNSEETRLTATVEILGTPRYMAPERVRNEAPTPASDLFSLGATLYFAVEGTGPFDRATAVTTLSALLFEPATLSLRAAELTPVLLGLLAKEPADRSDGAEAVQQLTAIAAQPHPSSSQQPALPPKMPPPERARPPASKPPRAEESAPPTEIPSQPERGEPTSTPLGALPHKNEGDEARLPPHPPRSRRRRARLVAGAALVALVAGGGGIYVTQCRSPSPELRASTSVLSMPVDKSPQGVAASPNGRRVYVTSYSSGSVSVIDPNTDRTVGKPIPVGHNPERMTVSPDGRRVYVTSYSSDSVSVIDTTTDRTVGKPIPVGDNPEGVAVSPDGRRLYVVNGISASVSVIDTAKNRTVGSPIPVGRFPKGVVVSPDGRRLYVTNFGSASVSVIDTTTDRTVGKPIPVGHNPEGVAVSPDGRRVYVTNGPANSVSVIDTAKNRTVGSPIPVGSFPKGVVVSPDGRWVYVANAISASVSVIDTTTDRTVGKRIPVGRFPAEVTVSPDGHQVYVANGSSNSVSVITF